MAKRIPMSVLNATTADIINTIRANASYEYQSNIPVVTTEHDLPKVGDNLWGYPALANQFINSLVNRIALVNIKTATFYNDYVEFKKGYLQFGETVEEAFVNIAKAREFSAEKAVSRENARTLPDVRAAFHVINWRVQYPITIQNTDLRQAFMSWDGVEDLIAKIVDSVYRAAEYDEYLLFKYLIIKAVSHGKMYPVAFDSTNMTEAAENFRGYSNSLTFMSKNYNAASVTTATPREDQYIFMDSMYNAKYDVGVLAAAFHMEKAEFMGRLKLIDSFSTFDSDRFSAIMAATDGMEAVTTAELELMKNVKAVLVDKEWFQVYDNLAEMTENYVAAGMYWNYFYNVWKTISSSPFSNAIVFVDDGAATTPPPQIVFTVQSKVTDGTNTIITLVPSNTASLSPSNYHFVQSEDNTTAGVAVHPYGAFIYPSGAAAQTLSLTVSGKTYNSTATVASTVAQGATVTFKVPT